MIDQLRLGIVGAGPRATQVARALCRMSLISDLVLVDPVEPSHARLERADLFRLHAPIGPVSVRATGYDALQSVPLVVLALEPGEGAGDGLDAVVEAIDRHAPDAVVVVASHPSEAITRRVQTRSARPTARILGTGTLPDTLCLRAQVAAHLGVETEAVDLHVLGWHGSGAAPLWSRAQVGGAPLVDAGRLDAATRSRLMDACAARWRNADVAPEETHALCRIVHAVLKDTHAVLPVATSVREADVFGDPTPVRTPDGAAPDRAPEQASGQAPGRASGRAPDRGAGARVPEGDRTTLPYGGADIDSAADSAAPLAVSLPCVIGRHGVERVLLPPVEPPERVALHRCRRRTGRPPTTGLPGHAGRVPHC